jgi:replicative DNA helicase
LHLLRYYNAQGVKRFIFDHISIVFSHDERENERKLIDNVLSEVAAFCAATGSTMIMVAHIRRFDQKVHVGDEINDAKWLFISPDMARGSGSFEQLASFIVALEPEKTENEEKGRTRISIRKNREWGVEGPCDIIKMNNSTGRINVVREKEYDF